jgi:hypothetical protein
MCVFGLYNLRNLSCAASAALFVFLLSVGAIPSVVEALERPSASSIVTLRIPERLEFDLDRRTDRGFLPTVRRVNATDRVPVQLSWWATSEQVRGQLGITMAILTGPCRSTAHRWCAVVAEPSDE